MTSRRGLAFALLLGALALPTSVVAQPLRVGLVLSGGSAKGFAHAGVIRVLEQEGIPVHVVAGTSMGSIVGGAYAMGVSVDSIVALGRELDWVALFTDQVDRGRLTPDQREFDARTILSLPFENGSPRLPTGAVRGASIQRLFSELTWPAAALRDFRALPRSFVAVATDLETGEGVPLDHGVMAEALRASMAIPGAVQPIEIDGRTLVDGGLARNLPAQDAEALGADILICSDVSGLGEATDPEEEVGSLLDIIWQTAAYRMDQSTEAQRERCDVLITPHVEGISAFDFGAIDEWLARGEAAADSALDRLRAVFAGRTLAPAPVLDGRFPGRLPDSVTVTRLEVDHADPRARRLVARELDLDEHPVLERDRLDDILEDVYATGLVGPLGYRIETTPTDTTLVVTIAGGPRDKVGFGLRYDDQRRAALLFSATLYDRLSWGSAARFDVRLGEELQARASWIGGRALTGALSLGAELGYARTPEDLYIGSVRTGVVEIEATTLSAFVALTAERASIAAIELLGERVIGSTETFIVDLSEKSVMGAGAFWFLRESFDRTDFPRSGSRIHLRSELGLLHSDSTTSYSHHIAEASLNVPLHSRVTARVGAHLGYNTGDVTPATRQLFIGGDHPSAIFTSTQPTFAGLRSQFRFGNALQVFRAGLQLEVLEGRFLEMGVDAGGVQSEWHVDPGEWYVGWTLSLGTPTLLGPLKGTVSAGNGEVRWAFSLGRRF